MIKKNWFVGAVILNGNLNDDLSFKEFKNKKMNATLIGNPKFLYSIFNQNYSFGKRFFSSFSI